MIKIRKNDENNDWVFGHSQADYLVDNNLAAQQDIKTKIQEWKNDFFANLQAGIDYRTRAGQRGQKDALDNDLKQIIIQRPYVLALTKFESLTYDRDYSADFEVYTVFSIEPLVDTIQIGEV